MRVDIGKLDHMLNLAGEIAVAQADCAKRWKPPATIAAEELEAHEQVERLSLDLQEQIMKCAWCRSDRFFAIISYRARHRSGNGKAARLAAEGEDVEIDLSMVEHFKDPLTHMIRNALDHGIEAAGESAAPRARIPAGVITLKAHHDGANIVIEVSDDGAGLNRERIAARVRAGACAASPTQLSDPELFKFIFEPGFSTAEKSPIYPAAASAWTWSVATSKRCAAPSAIDSRQGRGNDDHCPLAADSCDHRRIWRRRRRRNLRVAAACGARVHQASPRTARRDERPRRDQLRGVPVPYIRLRDWFGLAKRTPDAGKCRGHRSRRRQSRTGGRHASRRAANGNQASRQTISGSAGYRRLGDSRQWSRGFDPRYCRFDP